MRGASASCVCPLIFLRLQHVVCATLFLSATTLDTVEASASNCQTYTISRIEFLKHPQYACDVKIMRLQIPRSGDALKAEYHST